MIQNSYLSLFLSSLPVILTTALIQSDYASSNLASLTAAKGEIDFWRMYGRKLPRMHFLPGRHTVQLRTGRDNSQQFQVVSWRQEVLTWSVPSASQRTQGPSHGVTTRGHPCSGCPSCFVSFGIPGRNFCKSKLLCIKYEHASGFI